MPIIDLTGQRFGRWTVTAKAPYITAKHRWHVQCDCGNTATVQGSTLLEGTSRSCGCMRDEVARVTFLKHGMYKSREYHSWQTAKERCHNPNNPGYQFYGKRGIVMCAKWRQSFQAFYQDMGPRPEGMSLDRIDPNGNYEPGNVRWATDKQQQRNKRSNRLVTYKGETMTVVDWAERLGLSYVALTHRLNRGWKIDRAFHQALQRK